jgi:hypothetical protein
LEIIAINMLFVWVGILSARGQSNTILQEEN